MRSGRLWRCTGLWVAGAAGVLVAALGAPDGALARTGAPVEATKTLLGSYLAGRFARGVHDTTAAAAFYRQALERDPGNEQIIEQAFMMEVSEGNASQATDLARQLIALQSGHRMARTWLGATEFKHKNYALAEGHFAAASPNPLGELASALARAWVKLAEGNSKAALALLEAPRQAEWVQHYLRYHRALISDLSGRRAEARQAYERIFKADSRTPRTVLAYAQSAAHAGDLKLARSVVKEHLDKSAGEGHPVVLALRDRLQTNGPVPLLVESAEQGLAEVFYGLGEALSGEGLVSVGIIYLQIARYISPDSAFALAALANAYETTRRYDQAIEVYELMPRDTPLQMAIDIRKAINLNLLERVEEAREMLEKLAESHPGEIRPLEALGNIMRARKRYAEAAEYYSRAIALISKPEKRHWAYWYSRGTCYERLKKWPLAEVDLQKALQLHPDQPLVLNYLGYSWIDQNRNLRQGLAMIEKAVALKPDDGYIVDSLGWAHYRLGNFKEAVKHLERAVGLRPEDPVLNDHLGDALWRVGRQREAFFQWQQSLTLMPEPEDAEKTAQKLRKGLPEKPIVRAQKKTKDGVRTETQKKRLETKVVPTSPFQ